MLFHIVLKKLIKIGTLHVIDPEGRTRTFSGKPGPEATIRIHDKSQDLKLFLNQKQYLIQLYPKKMKKK